MIPFKPGSRVGHIVDPVTGCWLWQGSLSWNGYGIVGIPGTHRTTSAQRVYYEREHGPVPRDRDLDHLCRVRRCVNPAHLEPVTRKENSRRGAKSKLTEDIVREMVARYRAGGITQRALAAEYGIHHSYFCQIWRGKRRSDDTATKLREIGAMR